MIATNPGPDDNPKPKAYASIGAGELTSLIWKRLSADGTTSYEFNLFRILPRSRRTTGLLKPKHLRSIIKIVYLVATAMLEDRRLSPDDKSDLLEIDDQLRPVVFPRSRF